MLTEKIERFQQSLLDADKAGGLPVLEINKDIDEAIEKCISRDVKIYERYNE